MPDKDIPETLELVFKEQEPESPSGHKREYGDVGPSSLHGRRGDNITFHPQGVHLSGYSERMWSWAWKDLGKNFLGLLRLFSFRER